jgi:hypothetical protein
LGVANPKHHVLALVGVQLRTAPPSLLGHLGMGLDFLWVGFVNPQ